MRKLLGTALIAALVAAAATPALASSAQAGKAAVPVKNAKVDVDQFAFIPAKLKIKRGTKVVWKWVDGTDVQHNIAVVKGPVKFHSGLKSSGTYSHLFKTKGTYQLHCTIHPFMTETVIVK